MTARLFDKISLFRHEILRYALRLIPDSIQLLLSHTYICITFLVMYGTMWSLNMRFDTRFFAVASCMFYYLEYSLLEFGRSVGDFVNYLTAVKRIQVSFMSFSKDTMDIE